MEVKPLLAKPFAQYIYRKVQKEARQAVAHQDAILQNLLKNGRRTLFGSDHSLKEVEDYKSFKQAVPIRDYEGLSPYMEKAKEGKQNVLWKGSPLYFAKTSGTTSGVKYIPITKDSISNHIDTARNSLLCYIAETGNNKFTGGRMVFLSGSPTLTRIGGVPTGRLSGIVNHHIPYYLRKNQLPDFETNCIEDWETKLDKIVEQTMSQDMRLISGIPPWMQMYFDRLSEKSGKRATELFPNFSILVHGGVNFEPYKKNLFDAIGREIDTLETFPASEGFFAFQDSREQEGLLLNTNSGIFYEFVPVDEIFDKKPTRLSLHEVKTGVNYAVIINSNAGLWGYNLGDTVKFVSLDPYRLVVSGRTKHFISAFGEHVIAEEVEHSLMNIAGKKGIRIVEFTVAPFVQTAEGERPYHEWFVEFEQQPENIEDFALEVDKQLQEYNIYYKDLQDGRILQPLKIRPIKENGFIDYMKSIGKLGGQNKVPRLSNNRNIANKLTAFVQ